MMAGEMETGGGESVAVDAASQLNAQLVEILVFSALMGKRKSKRKAPTAKKNVEPLATQFNCPFCNHESSCEVKMDRERNVGFVSCRVCMEDFQAPINYLSEAVDVYSDWIDACEAANA